MLTLENEQLAIELYDGLPIVGSYLHKETGLMMKGGTPEGRLLINGSPVTWDQWQIERLPPQEGEITYRLSLSYPSLSVDMRFRLENNALSVGLERIHAIGNRFETLGWDGLPLIVCEQPDFRYWREEWSQKQWDSPMGRGLYHHTEAKRPIRFAVPDEAPKPTLHACLYNDRMCCFVHSNYPYLPLKTELSDKGYTPGRSNTFSISLNQYQYKIRDRYAEELQFRIVFLSDTNDDGKADECDYQLWLNRQYPAPNSLYKDTLWYKIFCASPEAVSTTFAQALDIIRNMHELTGGMPQLVYLVGWQYDGHDTGYPSLDRINARVGTHDELLELHRTAKEKYNCTVSFHINVDDSYREHPGWDEQVICRDTNGDLMTWETFNGKTAYHICHTKDVESGKLFGRLNRMLELLPVEMSIHLDAFRCTNCSWEPDGYIGVMEELECGVKPIISYFNEKQIDVSTEGTDSLGIEAAGLFSGVWHMSHPQIYHGKLIGGGRRPDVIGYGIGASLNIDLDYQTLRDHPDLIRDRVYLGAMLYKFYMHHEMLEYRNNEREQQIEVRFDGGVTAIIGTQAQELSVMMNDVTIADGGDRFIPLQDAIYIYSNQGGVRTWRLPEGWQGDSLVMYRLEGNGGKRSVSPISIHDREITIHAEPKIPLVLYKKQTKMEVLP